MNKRTILVVEDDESPRTYLIRFLSSRGYTVQGVGSGEEAIARLASGYSPNIVILDLLLSGMDGIEVLAQARNQGSPISAIMLSGVGQVSRVVEAMKMGAADYLVKPFEEEELELAIGNVLEKQQLKNEIKSLHQQLDQSGDDTDF